MNRQGIRPVILFGCLLTGAVVFLLSTAVFGAPVTVSPVGKEAFQDYWYPNGAEISRFALKQSRYGEIHEGDAVLVFVTEPVNPQLQVKADRPAPENVPVLKLNSTRKFYTGVYPYSVMTSVFAPVDVRTFPLPLKISFSAQEWCGHVYGQMNLREGRYDIQEHSYFEAEADRQYAVPGAVSEDALWTLIRIAPESLPVGTLKMIPGMLHSRFAHTPMAVREVVATLDAADRASAEGRELAAYTVRYPESGRMLTIFFEREFPFRIDGWRDASRAAPHFGGKELTTEARRTHILMLDYWNRHTNADRRFLQNLGLGVE
ncbi:hypothetical protein [Desulfococcus sp.]|uniref:hypothetical protein n=1 Tax=Desulfococcus sp. TaxID=2025834 RepID=UPI0035947E70